MPAPQKYRFTLVHGTFSANARWIREHEDDVAQGFRARLKKSVGGNCEFNVPPPWGALSWLKRIFDLTNAARLNGAEILKSNILETPLNRNEKHYILAHSHGGNTAMYAMQDPAIQQRIDGVICMATPFLFPRVRPISLSTLALSIVILITGVFQFIWKMDLWNSSSLAWGGAGMLILTGVIIPALLVGIVASERYKIKIQNDSKLTKHIAKLSYHDPHKPILVVRSSGDEASGLLRGTQFLNWIAGMAMRLGGRQIYALVCLGVLLLLWMAYTDISWLPDNAFTMLSSALVVSAAIMMMMLMILTMSRILVGLDAWRWVGELETMIEDGPPGIKSELVVISPRQPKNGLSHTAVYSEAETTEAIAAWCR